MKIRRVATLRTSADLFNHCRTLGTELPCDAEMEVGENAPLAQPFVYQGRTIGNRFAVLPKAGTRNLMVDRVTWCEGAGETLDRVGPS